MKSKKRKLSKNNPKNKQFNQNKNDDILNRLPQLSEIEKKINATVIGQEDAVKSICTKVYQSLYFPNTKSNILVVGRSGTGKTEIVRQLSAYIKIPCTIEDATKYTEEGYVGGSVTDMIENLVQEANGDIKLASRGIIFIDEIDKKTSRNNYYHDPVTKEGVLKSLLKIIEGTKVYIRNPNFSYNSYDDKEEISFDTSRIIFIFGGAFEGLKEVRQKRLKKNTRLGFASAEGNHIAAISSYMNTSFAKEDLIEYGLPAEFVGRISSIYETRELEVEDLRKILDVSKKSEFRKYERIIKKSGIELIYSDRLFELIASNAKKASTGARELNSLVSHIFERIMYDILSNAKIGRFKKCILDDEIVFDNTKYHFKQ